VCALLPDERSIDRGGTASARLGPRSRYCQLVEHLTWLDFVLAGIAAIAAAVSIVQAFQARTSRKAAAAALTEAQESRRAALEAADAANASRREASGALTQIADVLRERAEAETGWVAQSQGGGHLTWDVTNRTGRTLMARLDIPDQGPARLMDPMGSLFDTRVEPGESLHFKWERRGPAAPLVSRVNVIWSTAPKTQPRVTVGGFGATLSSGHSEIEELERMTPLRVTWPDA
jgi:multidrug efflux pump subunit AcrA (membrane-fusion protein)